jgi:hypothetical protein
MMTHPLTTDGRSKAQRAERSATWAVVYGFGITGLYFGTLSLGAALLGWQGDLYSFFYWATWGIPFASFAVGLGLLAARTPRLISRVMAGIACAVFAWLTYVVVSFAWSLNMTDWFTW